ncbi:MAG: hypothetical protein KBA14_04565 [Saprospiraceae bacterium]|nr:hypothetical protein [Saprospiraceae bacterium]
MKTLITYMMCLICLETQAQITLIKKDESCAGRKDGRIEVQVPGLTNGLTYDWKKNGSPFLKTTSKVISGLEPADYNVTVSTSTGCMGMKSARVWPGKTVSVDIAATLVSKSPDPVPCGVRPEYTYQLTGVISGGTPPYICSWGKGLGDTSGSGDSPCTISVTGSFINQSLTIIDSLKCVDSDGFKLTAGIRYCPKDPNDIQGPVGYDSVRWVSIHDVMDYTVRFENDPVFATSNASTVLITIPIDDDINPFSFRLGAIGFGDKILEIPANVSSYQHRYDFSSDLGIMIDLTAGLDLPNNRFIWLMETIDPITGQPPIDPMAGFLPLNDTLTGSGEGFVNFLCSPKNTTPTGEIVTHQAAIIFDLNDPIMTNMWSNTIDAFAPTTVVTPLADTLNTNEVSLNWSVNDDAGGCGVQHAEILLSTDNLAFQSNGVWSDVPVELILNWGTMYYYKVVGVDNVNNVEDVVADSFFIMPLRAINFISPSEPTYCYGDSLAINVDLISIPDADLYISIDSGMTYVLLQQQVDEWPYLIELDSTLLYTNLFVKARHEAENVEAIVGPFAVSGLPGIDAGPDQAGCPGDILFVTAEGANQYQWYPDSIFSAPSNRYSNIYPVSSGYVYVEGTNVFGCTNIDSAHITVLQTSLDSISQPLCQGDSVQIDGEWISEEGFYTSTSTNVAGCDSTIVTQVYFESPCIWTGGPYVYVDQDATGDNNGTSWADAFNELKDAIYVAGRYENVQEIWVAEGIYSPHPTNRDTSFILLDSIKIYGGFIGVELTRAERTANAELVQISGDINIADTLWDNSYHTIILSPDCQECILDGVTITYGHADQVLNGNDMGAGVLSFGKGKFYNVIFERNYASDQAAALLSTGMAADLIIENCIFRLNTSNLGRDVVNLNGAQVEFRGLNSIH